MTIYAILPLLAAVINIVLTFLVFTNNRQKKVVRPFLLLSGVLSAWNLSLAFLYSAPSPADALLFNHVVTCATMFIFSTNYHFIVYLTGSNSRINRLLIGAAYLLSLFFVYLHFGPRILSSAVKEYFWGYYPVSGPGDMIYGAVFVCYFTYSELLLYRMTRITAGQKRFHYRMIFWTNFIGVLGGCTNFLPIFNLQVYPIGNLSSILYYLAAVYALVTVKMVPVKYLLRLLARWTAMAAATGAAAFAMALFLTVFRVRYPQHMFMLALLAIVASNVFVALFWYLIILPAIHAQLKAARSEGLFAAGSSRILTPSLLTAYIIYHITRQINTDDFCIVLPGNGAIRVQRSDRSAAPEAVPLSPEALAAEYGRFGELMQADDGIVLRDELEKSIEIGRPVPARLAALAVEMTEKKIQAAVPLYGNGVRKGYVLLGDNRSGEMYDMAELSGLKELKVVAETAIENIEYVDGLVRQRNSIEQEMQRVNKLKAIGLLTSAIAHEIRNPLAAIKMASYNIRRKLNDDSLSRHITNINKKVEECDLIIQNLLTYSKVHEVDFEPVAVRALVREVCAAMQAKYSRYPAVIRETGVLPESHVINANPVQLKMLFTNLLDNAYQALPEHRGEIGIALDRGENGSVLVTVRDTGLGIDRADLPAVFEPFFTKKAKGIGLGLTVCRMIAEIHRGSIGIDSAAGQGTTVTVALAADAAAGPAADPEEGGRTAGDPEDLRMIEQGQDRLLRGGLF